MKHHFITVEGNIGAGKTTLTHLLAKHYNARIILEEFASPESSVIPETPLIV